MKKVEGYVILCEDGQLSNGDDFTEFHRDIETGNDRAEYLTEECGDGEEKFQVKKATLIIG